MNKVKLALLTAISIATAFTFLACEKKGKKAEPGGGEANAGCDGVKLLESIKYHSGNYDKFEYDDKNRIVKIATNEKTITLVYKGDDLIDIQGLDFKKNGNTITIDKSIITIDNDGYIVKKEYPDYPDQSSTYQYQAGNLIRISDSGSRHEYKYDDKKSPFFNCKTPKWFLSHYLNDNVGLRNNITEFSFIVNTEGVMDQFSYSFEYDSEGYPTKKTSYDPSEDEEIITLFTYRCVTSTKGANK